MPISSMVFLQPRLVPVEVPVDKTECEELRKTIRELEVEISKLKAEINVKKNYIQDTEIRLNETKQKYEEVNSELTAIKKILSR